PRASVGKPYNRRAAGFPVWQIQRHPQPRGEQTEGGSSRNWMVAEIRNGRNPSGPWRSFCESGRCAGGIVRVAFSECVRLAWLAACFAAEPARGADPGERMRAMLTVLPS